MNIQYCESAVLEELPSSSYLAANPPFRSWLYLNIPVMTTFPFPWHHFWIALNISACVILLYPLQFNCFHAYVFICALGFLLVCHFHLLWLSFWDFLSFFHVHTIPLQNIYAVFSLTTRDLYIGNFHFCLVLDSSRSFLLCFCIFCAPVLLFFKKTTGPYLWVFSFHFFLFAFYLALIPQP